VASKTGQDQSQDENQSAGRSEARSEAQSEALSYEQARDELASVVKRLETGGLTLEQSLDLWERGERLAAVCSRLLEGARARLSAATAERSGSGDDEDERPF
jgi:exodeoxyribonuclease VII small subunit